ncbi:riboflavin kinase [Patescibacteria group bacterium]|nr:riboflavin kinase [Patescibacteria group bacterium]
MTQVKSIRRLVVAGDKRGSKLGYPTANLEFCPEDNLPEGVWATIVNVNGQDYPSVTFVGAPVSFGGDKKKIEVFIFDYAGDLYDKIVRLDFMHWLRPVKKFADEKDLIKQITRDCHQAREVLSNK